jgi:hypothetical protein
MLVRFCNYNLLTFQPQDKETRADGSICFIKKNPQLDALISQIYFGTKLYMFRTVRLSIIRGLFTVHSAMVHVIQVCREPSSRTRMELQFHPGPANKRNKKLWKPQIRSRYFPHLTRLDKRGECVFVLEQSISIPLDTL